MPYLSQSPQTATAVSGKATVNCDAGLITTESLATVAGAAYTLTVGCNHVTSKSLVVPFCFNGSNSQGDPDLVSVTPADGGSITFKVINRHATLALNGTLKIGFVVFN
jgi:hypothetical protein